VSWEVTNRTLLSVLWRGGGDHLWPCLSPPTRIHNIIPEIVVTPPSKGSKTILPKEGEVRRRSSLQRMSLVAQDKDKKRRALDLVLGTGSATKVIKKEGLHVKSLDMNSKYDADLHIDIFDWDYQNILRDSSKLWRQVHQAPSSVEARLWEFETSSLLSALARRHWKLFSILAPKDGG